MVILGLYKERLLLSAYECTYIYILVKHARARALAEPR
jgi:hypothetical protein